MFDDTKVKKLIILCDEKTKPYANYLMALIRARLVDLNQIKVQIAELRIKYLR